MPARKSPTRKSPTRKTPVTTSADKQKIKELESQLADQQRKSKKLIDQVGEFQDEVGGAIVPYQRIVLYITVAIFFAVGLGMIIYAGAHPDMDDAENTRDNLYVAGGILLTFAVFAFFLGRFWLSTVEKSPGLRKLNATMFELEMAKGIFKK